MEITVMEASGEQDEQKNDDLLLLQQADDDSRLLTILKTRHSIDRHIVTIDEKYLRHCLELIYLTATVSSSSLHPSSWDSPTMKMFSYDLQKPSGELILGSITRGKTILNILESPFIYDQYVPPAIESSSTIAAYSDRPSPSSSFASGDSCSTGMLRVIWELGSPRFEYLFDDRKEAAAYVAELVKSDQSPDNNYVFFGNQSEIVGRMRVSTSVRTPSFKETQFVLFGAAEDDTIARSKSNFRLRGFAGKFLEAFKRGTETNGSSGGGWSKRRRVNFLEGQFLTNLELAAIVVNERVCCDRDRKEEEEENSGWGMKFLRKVKFKETKDTSFDIVVASGVHGGPKGGPSGLIERWRSSGWCDCGGWDVGCPIKVLKTRPNCISDSSSSFDLLIEGSNGVASTIMKMENINDNLYLLRMESTISILQSFAIAISFIHSKSRLHQLGSGLF